MVAAVLLWIVRPLWQGIALGLWTSPLVWLPPVLVLVAGALAYRRSRRWTTLEELQEPRRPPPYLAAFPILAFVLFIAGNALTGTLVARALATDTNYEAINSLPAGGQVRIVPREVAEQNASSAFNSSTETLTDFRIVNTADGLQWTALRTPQGAFRVFNRKSQGLVVLDAEQTARSLRQRDQELTIAPGLQITDNLRWRLLKRRFLIELTDAVGIETPRGPRIMVPYVSRSGILIRKPVLGGVFVVAPDGTIEDLEPAEAAGRPELAATGRIYPDTLARQVQDAYAYRGGVWNKWFVHENQTEISDTEENRQPYLINFPQDGPQWVTVAEPYGRAFAASAIFLTDARTGRTRIWRVPRGTSLSGNRRALQAVRAISIPGIDFGQGSGSGNFRVVEPRPVFVPNPDDPNRGGRLVYLTSIIPTTANAVSKTVVVDAESNKLVYNFQNDNDPQAEEKTQTYLATGRLPGDATQTQTPATPANGNGAAPSGGAGTNGRTPSVDQRLEQLLERQRELLEDTEALQDALREQATP